ncbi:T9SS type A sorting domain-containing protein [Tenacibaculum sp. UWU-22]|uniref:T9SS type A sorting domain-containing protein n=1 Tax=Tenacibaculum sp. UWU-22 TaxID=3234187 RepID=UPI0034DB691E
MTKKILFLFFLFVTAVGFSQKSIKNLSTAPNPFVQNTTITFFSDKNQTAILNVRNVLGKTVYSEKLKIVKGENRFPFYRKNLQSGMYIYALQNSEELISKRFVIK